MRTHQLLPPEINALKNAGLYDLLDRGIVPVAIAACQAAFVYLLTTQVRNGGEL